MLKLYTWMAPEEVKTCISVFKAVHFTIFPESVFFFSNISLLPGLTCEPWKLSLSLPLADNPYQNSCTHKTLTTSWLAVIQLFEWTAVGEQSLEHGRPEAYLLMWLTSCCFLWSLQARPGSLPVAAGTRELEESLKPFHLPLSVSIWHPLLLSAFPRARRRPCRLRLRQVLTLRSFHTHYQTHAVLSI